MNMNTMRPMLIALSVTCVTAVNAWSADLPARPAPPVAMPAPVYNWTGIYFGINGGGGWGDQQPLNLITNRFDGRSADFSGGVFGGTAGAQIQMGHVVVGFETDIDWTDLSGSSTFVPTVGGVPVSAAAINATSKVDWEATARARIGYAEQNWLLYATGGLAILHTKSSFTPPAGVACSTFFTINCSGSGKQIGAALGGGIEYGISQNLSAKVEYLYITAASLDVSHHSEIRGGLNYRFGGN
ncbi:outer membrane protein [Nitrobacter sp.]|jgi:outer membrane immunogenic protein|uniref:outer membrane protein n=1 Tax=Nitrobacter sp. TaxID=29420 RepID=UPI0029CAC615|nr:outer membrane beta-barrel protein [Nitrobacter sp.]